MVSLLSPCTIFLIPQSTESTQPRTQLALNLTNQTENISLRRAAEGCGDHAHTTANGYPTISEKDPEMPSSLVEYIIRRHGTTEQKLTDGEIEQLGEWFRGGGGMRN